MYEYRLLMEHSELYNFDILGRLDQEGIKYLVKVVYCSDQQTQTYSDDSEEQKLIRNALRAGNIGILDELGLPRSVLNLVFDLQHSDFRTIVHAFEKWTYSEESDGRLTSLEMIVLAKKNTKWGDRTIKFIKEVEELFGDIYIPNIDPEDDLSDYGVFYELNVYLKNIDLN